MSMDYSTFEGANHEEMAQLDRFSEEYESKRISGLEVQIEEWIEASPESIRDSLFFELIRIEIELHWEWDKPFCVQEYQERFPKHALQIEQLWFQSVQERTRVESAVSLTPAAEVSHRFEIKRRLAQGGIGTIYVAMDLDLQREVAIKVLKRRFFPDTQVVRRFETEATITGMLEHPNIIPVYAKGVRSDSIPFYAMRLIRGKSLQQAIREFHQRLNSRRTSTTAGVDTDIRHDSQFRDLLGRLISACRAVGFAHSKSVVHRDIKPSNIMVDDFGETLVVDWGLATPLHNKDVEAQTDIGVAGTRGFMSPEQSGAIDRPIGPLSDIYSLGATLNVLVTGCWPRAPWNTGHATDVAVESRREGSEYSIALDRSPSSSFAARELIAIANKATEFEPSQRYASIAPMVEDLEAWLADEPISCASETLPIRCIRWFKRYPRIVSAGLATAFSILLATSIGIYVLSIKNETLRLSNEREKEANLVAQDRSKLALKNAAEAEVQRKKALVLLDRFLVDVGQGLKSVPGGAAVQQNVLRTILDGLKQISLDFQSLSEVEPEIKGDIRNAVALHEFASLVGRVGAWDTRSSDERVADPTVQSPISLAVKLETEAVNFLDKIENPNDPMHGRDAVQLRADILVKRAEFKKLLGEVEGALSDLTVARDLYNELQSSDSDNESLLIAAMSARDLIGQIYLDTKTLSESKEIFQDVVDRADRVILRYPHSRKATRALAIAFNRMSMIASREGDIEKAAYWLDKDVRLTSGLLSKDPSDTILRRDQAIAYDRIAKMHELKGKPEDAILCMEQSLQVRTEIVESEPNDQQAMRELFVSRFKLGQLLVPLDRIADAKAHYYEAQLIADRLSKLDTQSLPAKRFQSMVAESLCDVAIVEKDLDSAVRHSEVSLAFSQKIADSNPANLELKRDVFVVHTKVAKVYRLKKDYDNCDKQLELAEGIAKELVERTNQSVASLLDASSILLRKGEAAAEVGKIEDAILHFTKAIEIVESIPPERRDSADALRFLSNGYRMKGGAYMAKMEMVEASKSLLRARQIATEMIARQMRVSRMQADLEEIDLLLEQVDSQGPTDGVID